MLGLEFHRVVALTISALLACMRRRWVYWRSCGVRLRVGDLLVNDSSTLDCLHSLRYSSVMIRRSKSFNTFIGTLCKLNNWINYMHMHYMIFVQIIIYDGFLGIIVLYLQNPPNVFNVVDVLVCIHVVPSRLHVTDQS